MHWEVGGRAITSSAASASQMGFEAKWLRRSENLAALVDLPGQWIDQAYQRRPPMMVWHGYVDGAELQDILTDH